MFRLYKPCGISSTNNDIGKIRRIFRAFRTIEIWYEGGKGIFRRFVADVTDKDLEFFCRLIDSSNTFA